MCRVELARMSAALRAPLSVCSRRWPPASCWPHAPAADSPAAISSPSQPAAPQPQAGSQIGAGTGQGRARSCRCRRAGNAGVTAQSMRNAAELALSEFNNPDIQLLVKDDGGSAPGAQQAAQQLLDEGAEIILGPLFAHSVAPVGQLARARGIPVIAFSTDSNVAARRRLSAELPAGVRRRAAGRLRGAAGQALLSPRRSRTIAYGTVVEAAFKQSVGRRSGRIVALERYPVDRNADAGGGPQSRAGGEHAPTPSSFRTPPTRCRWWCRRSPRTASTPASVQLLGSGLWEDPQIFSSAVLEGAWYAGPDVDRLPQFLRPLPQPLRTRTRCAPRRWSMTRSRWSRR